MSGLGSEPAQKFAVLLPDPDLDTLARKVAELLPNWALPGMACRDGDKQWRFVPISMSFGTSQHWVDDQQGVSAWLNENSQDGESLRRAVANGPDHTDELTMLGLLAHAGQKVRRKDLFRELIYQIAVGNVKS